MWKANGKTTTLQTFLDSLSPETLNLEEAMDLSRDRNEMMMMRQIWTTLKLTSNELLFYFLNHLLLIFLAIWCFPQKEFFCHIL
jgi:hypothetical protein